MIPVDTTAFDTYLKENRARNRAADEIRLSKIQKIAEDFDPLLDSDITEADAILSLDQNNDRLAEKENANALVINSIVQTKRSSPQNINASRTKASTSETSAATTAKKKRGRPKAKQ